MIKSVMSLFTYRYGIGKICFPIRTVYFIELSPLNAEFLKPGLVEYIEAFVVRASITVL